MRHWTTECRRRIRQLLVELAKVISDDDQDIGRGCWISSPQLPGGSPGDRGRGGCDGCSADLLTGGSACASLIAMPST